MKKYMGRYWGGQSIQFNRPMGGAHESDDKKVSTRPKYTSNKKSILKNTYSFGRSSNETRHKIVHIWEFK